MLWQTIIHLVFLFSAVAIAMIDRIMTGTPKTGKSPGAAH
jgi:uncharacterized membrane protein YqhA